MIEDEVFRRKRFIPEKMKSTPNSDQKISMGLM